MPSLNPSSDFGEQESRIARSNNRDGNDAALAAAVVPQASRTGGGADSSHRRCSPTSSPVSPSARPSALRRSPTCRRPESAPTHLLTRRHPRPIKTASGATPASSATLPTCISGRRRRRRRRSATPTAGCSSSPGRGSNPSSLLSDGRTRRSLCCIPLSSLAASSPSSNL